MRNKKILQFILVISFILIGVGFRFLPHAPNFTPIAAIALFGGVYFSKKIALVLPLTIMVLSDIFIGYYEIGIMLSVYLSFLVCVLLGFYLKKNKKWQIILGSAFLCSLVFYLITNFAVWLFSPWYVKDFSGLITCYVVALPFFKNTVLGDFIYIPVFFGAYESVKMALEKRIKILRENSISNHIS